MWDGERQFSVLPIMKKITRATMDEALVELGRRDPDFQRLYDEIGLPPMRSRPPTYGSLFKIICGQQVSTASAAAISKRLEAATNPLTPENYLALSDDEIAPIGLSRQKAAYGRAIAEAIVSGDLKLRAVARMDDEEAIANLTQHKGVGRWTAEVYLLFALRRPDLWPVDDLAVIKGLMHFKGMTERPARKDLIELAEAWRPWRSVVARMMWHYLRMVPVS